MNKVKGDETFDYITSGNAFIGIYVKTSQVSKYAVNVQEQTSHIERPKKTKQIAKHTDNAPPTEPIKPSLS